MMRKIVPVIFITLLFACAQSKKEIPADTKAEVGTQTVSHDSFSISEVIPSVTSRKNSDLSYALYLPQQHKNATALPAIIFADPHGDGAFPLNRYKALAEQFGVILIGSNDCKNGLTFVQATPILQALAAEAGEFLNADPRQISFAGFSGGAKAAMMAASETPGLLALVYCGAGFQEIPQPLPPALGIAGKRDMNFTEVINTDEQIGNKNFGHALIEWNGKHEWSDSSTFVNSFYWIRFRAMEKKLAEPDESLIHGFISLNSKTNPDPLQEERRLKKLADFLKGVSDISTYTRQIDALKKQKGYQVASAKQAGDYEVENRMKQNYLKCIELKDLIWWRDEINHLRTSHTQMDERILGYISLACYSYSSAAMKQQNLQAAEKFLGIYMLADRENPDRAFLQACWYGRTQNKAGVIEALKEAVRYGFSDKQKIANEDAFTFMRSTPEFNELVSGIK